MPIIPGGEEFLEYIGVRFLDFVEQYQRVGHFLQPARELAEAI
jgi:hypothetical protein